MNRRRGTQTALLMLLLAVLCAGWAASDDEARDLTAEGIAASVARLASPDLQTRIGSAMALAQTGDPRAAEALLTALREECSLTLEQLEERGLGAEATGGPGVQQVNQDLKNRYFSLVQRMGGVIEVPVRTQLQEEPRPHEHYLKILLAFLGDKTVYPDVVELLQTHEDGYVRADAALSLGYLGMWEAIPVLKQVLDDPFEVQRRDLRGYPVRSSARAAIMKIVLENDMPWQP